jgi:hypothetical protein
LGGNRVQGLGFRVPTLAAKDKDAARMGHPGFWRVREAAGVEFWYPTLAAKDKDAARMGHPDIFAG